MSRLTKGMYGHQFQPQSNLFGLRCGQIRIKELCHNAGWYNRQGEKLGYGDLVADDFRRIAAGLEEDELFIILGEHDSFWNFVVFNPGTIGSDCLTSADEQAPGVDYVAAKCRFIIAPRRLYLVDRWGARAENKVRLGNLWFNVLKQSEAEDLIRRGRPERR